ncbi:MAG: ABC transporter substrate-binding protein/permease [Verrucomicrobia bacterium]|nr:ABC transporter substrate-binding protein/permease [Verrucomicrobiota bacterium]
MSRPWRPLRAALACGLLAVLTLLAGAFDSYAANEPGPFRVALTGKYPPFSMPGDRGELIGFDVDVSREVAERLGRPLSLVQTEWDGILPGLLAGKYDAIIGSMAVTPERRSQVDFSMPYYQSGAQLFIHERHVGTIKSINDCAGLRLGVVLGETFERYLREKRPEINVVTYKDTNSIFLDVNNGRLAGFVSDRLLGAYQIKTAGQPFVPVGDLLYRETMAVPVTKDNTVLLDRINTALDEMWADGVINTLHQRWFGVEAVRPELLDGTPAESTGMRTGTIARLLGKGFAVTLGVALASILIGFALAVPGGLVLNNPGIPGHQVLRAVNDFIRGTPVLIQLFFVYFGLGSKQVGLNLSPISAAIVTLSINASAYMSEVVRSGLMAVDRGQTLAGRALGLSRTQVFGSVVWPQAFRIALPPLMNSVVALIKDTALISVIAVGEVIREAQSIIAVTFNPLKYYLIVAVMFFIVTFPLMKLASRLEHAIKRKGFA